MGASLVEPDQSYSIRDILERFTRGNAPAVERDPIYEIDKDFNEFDDVDFETNPMEDGDFDIVDVEELKRDNDERLSRIRQEISNIKKQVSDNEPTKNENE